MAVDYKEMFRKLELTLDTLESSDDVATDLRATVRRIVDDFRDELGIVSARYYLRDGDAFSLREEYPTGEGHVGFRIPVTYEPIQEVLHRGFVLRRAGDPGVDANLERALDVEHFAAIGFGDRMEYLVSFTLGSIADPEHVVYTLNTIRHVVRLKLREAYYSDRVAQARRIQMSLLPKEAPTFGDFDIATTMRPAEEVGGDLYDYITVSERVLGLAVADSAGHGLPAALQARDAIIGLRMGVEERLRITAVLEKLNRVVSDSALASKFISLFYGELEPNGTFAYCNAGHPAALVFRDGDVRTLDTGGLILGPSRDARYRRGYVTLEPGDVLVVYTDGITEASAPDESMFEVDRIRATVLHHRDASAETIVAAIFDAVDGFTGGAPASDDRTVMVVRRPARGKGSADPD